MSKSVRRPQVEAHQNPSDQDRANSARIARNSRRNAIRAAKQSCTMPKLQGPAPKRSGRYFETPDLPIPKRFPCWKDKAPLGRRVLRIALFPHQTPGTDNPDLKPPRTDLRDDPQTSLAVGSVTP